MKVVHKNLFISLFIGLFLVLSAVGQTVNKDEINKSIWKFSSEADQRFIDSNSRFEFKVNDGGKNYIETFYFSLNDKKIEKLIYEKLEGEMKISETFYFKKGKLVMSYEEELKKDRNDWQTIWSLSITVHEDKVLDYVSNGKGKTEVDGWEPKPIELSRKRIETLKERLKSINL